MRRPERATPKIVERVVTENEIRPKLRFLLSDAARAEGKQMTRNFRCYTLSRRPEGTRCQFESLVRGIRDGRFPYIAAANEIMGGVLTDSLQKIADGFRQPETMLWYQSWPVHLEQGRPDLMEGAANMMMTRNERWLPRIIDDETALLPRTNVNAVYAGGGVTSGDYKIWTPSREVALYRRYRDFIEYLEDKADGDETVRIVENPVVSSKHSVYLALRPGRGGGVGLGVALKGTAPAAAVGITFKINPTTSAASVAVALSTESTRALAKTLLTPGAVDLGAASMFAEGLRSLVTIPYVNGDNLPEASAIKPPSLDTELWRKIPRNLRMSYVKEMAAGLRLGVHPDDTVTELLAAA